jgi:hypothetical protein
MKLTKEDGKFILEGDCQCGSCGGTGLYVGMAERDAAAVICTDCEGTGKIHIKETFNEFTERKKKNGVKRVYETSGGYGITSKDITTPEGLTIHFSKFGVDYKDWLKGQKPLPIEELHCPYQHTSQDLQNHDVNNLYKNRCIKKLGGYIPDCKFRKEMDKCWDIYFNRK